MRRRELAAAVVLIVCGLVYGFLSWGLPERSLPNTPGPPFFPLLLTVILLVLSVALFVRAFASERDDASPATTASAVATQIRGPTLWLLGAFLAYVVLLPTLGFIVATIPFFASLMVLFGERRPVVVVFTAIAATAVLYVLFRHGFSVFLPRGILQGIVE